MTDPVDLPKPGKDLLAALAALMLAVAIAVLLIDWRIKENILKESQKFRSQMDRFEARYYEQGLAVVDRDSARPDPIGTNPVDGATGVAKETFTGTSRNITPARKASARIRPEPGTGNGSVEVSQEDGGVGA